MTAAALIMLSFEIFALDRLRSKYFGDRDDATSEEFISRASLDDIIKFQRHLVGAFLAFCLLSMSKFFP